MVAEGRTGTSRCTLRKHVVENGSQFCDCGQAMVGPTAAGNATVVTLFTVNANERARFDDVAAQVEALRNG